MKTSAPRAALRWAVCASVALHVVAAAVVFVLVQSREAARTAPSIDTRAPHVQMHLDEIVTESEVRPAPPAPLTPTTPSANQVKPPAPPSEPITHAPEPTGTPGPVAPAVPRTLPPELVALIRRPGANSTAAATPDTNVKPAGATGTPAPATVGRALHGALKPAQTVVYVLDCSGSMGAAGKFATARLALGATLAQQPVTVRCQVVVYDSSARALVPGGTMLATAENIDTLAAKLAGIEPRGKSNHLVALRAALDLKPDVVVWLTDADDLTAAAIQPVLKAAGRPVPVCVGLVTAAGVQQPRELK